MFSRQMQCRQDKARENAIALEVLPDLLTELDAQDCGARLTSVLEGVLASNIFDWGARDTVKLYRDGTILEIYRWAERACTVMQSAGS